MKTIKRWLWLILVIAAIVVLGMVFLQQVFHLRPVVARVMPAGDELCCNADGYPVLEEIRDPLFDPSRK